MSKHSKSYLAELFGTFAFVFIGAGSIIVNNLPGIEIGLLGIAVAHGLALSIAVTATMNTSGGHINPAVTLGLCSIGKCKLSTAVGLIISQLTGAALAGFLLYSIFPMDVAKGVSYGTPMLGDGVTTKVGLMIEGIATALLAMAIYGTAASSKKPEGIGGFGVGLTVASLILVIGPLTGAAMNPARHFGVALFSGQFPEQWLYWLGPVIGAVVGFKIFSCVFEDKTEEEE